MPRSTRLRDARITTVRFKREATADHVVARLLEAVRRTDLSLLSLDGDGICVYPFETHGPIQSATSWSADLLWRDGASDVGGHLEAFVSRANLLLDCRDGVHVESTAPRRRSSSEKRIRRRGAYGLDGAFGASSNSPPEA